MTDGTFQTPLPRNETVRAYAPGSADRAALERALEAVAGERLDVPALIGGEERRSGDTRDVVMPCDHGHVLASVHVSDAAMVSEAIDAARAAAPAWSAMPFAERAAIFLKAAELLAGPWRMRINAACMLGQAKTCHQAEIDAACELIDFLRFNVAFAERMLAVQPESGPGLWNRSDYRPLEGFVFAVTPFNFLAIAVNLPLAPALLGNVVVWKPATQTMVGVHHMLALLREAGLPEGVINVVPGDGPAQGEAALASPHLAGVHFTGSTATFRALYQGVAAGLDRYRAIPRIVGETGGKDFIVAHPSADVAQLATAIVRGAFEYQGQKCSAASRLYLPKSLWPALKERVLADMAELTQGDVRDFSNFLAAVIDRRAYDKHVSYQALARDTATVLSGGGASDAKGYFVEPTFVQVEDPKHRMMQEEIFGPIVTAYVYDDAGDGWPAILDTVDETSPYALTGAVFARERSVLLEAQTRLRHAAGNFYLNDKPTGAVVGQQPFGGGRASGTNDKAGSLWNLTRWVSPRSIKENLNPPTEWRYPFLG
ncbi:MAG: L-glutamate gamma-semialdehyde dehydrogenase [Myxococcota bacterium]